MKQLKAFFLFFVFLFLFVSCKDFSFDLNVNNLEHPDDYALFSSKEKLTEVASTILNKWYMTVHDYSGPAAALQTMADVSTSSWSFSGSYDLSSEPRIAWNNSPAYGQHLATSRYFDKLYSLLFEANLLVEAVEKGVGFENPDLMKMIGKVGQALSVGYLSLVFDRVWISDKNSVVDEGPVDYKEAMIFAIQKLDDAIALAKSGNVDIPESWLPGGFGANSTLVPFLNSMGARFLVGNVRNSAQKSSIDWDRVLTYANAGLTVDFEIYMDDVTWYDLIPKTYMVYPGFGRVDMRIINLMDPNTTDYWSDETVVPESTSIDARLATDYQYLSSQNFRPDRGTYHFSSYRYARLDDYISAWTMNVVEFSASENDMYKAEAMLNKGDVAGAAAIVNAGTRVIRGQLPDVAADAAAVQAAIHYERMVEFAYTGIGIGFFEMRKENLLQAGTMLHFPVPGKALETIQEEYYTFGGTEGIAGEDYSIGGWR
ncbi:MAG: hypothetical protein HN778_11210 [Prolixibacteraceae bacterium]|jgi:starch-binding outer membrane protein, SusD/RagB family|nr:hypothetical protein [Prolixibacteraceae bacterium]MBT6763616.1 hypothetical protein [Prolixibacteraceae bacterium]MBT7000363.1 hypothetical protein [Prolixibacteraceae bacterium]MBT7395391.1 hypothetical protein [Prolixibacteraceae bacterium]